VCEDAGTNIVQRQKDHTRGVTDNGLCAFYQHASSRAVCYINNIIISYLIKTVLDRVNRKNKY